MGSLSSGIVSCAMPFVALELGPFSLAGSGLMVPFDLSLSGCRFCCGELDASDARVDSLRRGDPGRAWDGLAVSRSLDLPLPNEPSVAPKLCRLEDDLRSGDDARPYGCLLSLRRPSTVPKRLRVCRPPLCLRSSTIRS